MNIVAMSESNANFTCLQGYVKTTYDELVTVFGSPKYVRIERTKLTQSIYVNCSASLSCQ